MKANKYKFTIGYLMIEPEVIKELNTFIEIVSFFKCDQCGRCCRISPTLYSDECKHYSSDKLVWKDDDNVCLIEPCPFFANNICKIQNYKPRICRAFPFAQIHTGNFDIQRNLLTLNKKVTISQCKIGREIFRKYLLFLDETNREMDIDVGALLETKDYLQFDTNLSNAQEFVLWLKQRL